MESYKSLILSTVPLWTIFAGLAAPVNEIDAEDTPPSIVEPPDDVAPEFGSDILPLLQRSCLACHNASTAEGGVVLESADDLLKDGDAGPLVIPGDLEASRLWQLAAHLDEPAMPPEDNDVDATALSPVELGLLMRWIEQGARGDDDNSMTPEIEWQRLPSTVRPIYAANITESGDYAICARGNELQVYDLRRGELLATLADPALAEPESEGLVAAAHLDLIGAVASHGDGEWIASGGYGTVKLWRRQRNAETRPLSAAGPAQPSVRATSGQQLATARGGTVYLTSLVDGKQRSWETGDQEVVALALAADSSQLISAAANGTVRRWDTSNGAGAGQWKLPVDIATAARLGNGQLVTAGQDGSLRVWDLRPLSDEEKQSGAPPELEVTRELIGHSRNVNALTPSPQQADQVLSGSTDGTLRIWNTADGTELAVLPHGHDVKQVAVTPDATRAVSVGDDGSVILWNVAEKQKIAKVGGDFYLARILARAERAVTVAEANRSDVEGTIKAAEEQLGKDRETLEKADTALQEATKTAEEKAAALEPLRAQLAELRQAVTDAQAARQQTEEQLAKVTQQLQGLTEQLEPAVKALAAAADAGAESPALREVIATAQEALTAARAKKQQQLEAQKTELDSALAEQSATLESKTKLVEESTPPLEEAEKADQAANEAAASAEQAKQRATDTVARTEKNIEQLKTDLASRIEDVALAQRVRQSAFDDSRRADSAAVASVAFSPDGRQLVVGKRPSGLYIYDVETGDRLDRFAGGAARLVHASYIDDGRLTVVDDQRNLTIRETRPSWVLHRTIGNPTPDSPVVDRVLAIDFSPDGRLVAVGSGEPSRSGQISVWRVEDGTLRKELSEPHTDSVFALAFSPSGDLLASSSSDRLMRVFDLAEGELVRTFEGHTHHVVDVVWRANGKQLATCSADKNIKIWDFASGEQLRSIGGPAKEITAISFLGIGNQLASVSGDKQIRIHNVDDGKQLRSFTVETDYLYCCSATELGDTIVTGGDDPVFRVWNTADGKERFAFTGQ